MRVATLNIRLADSNRTILAVKELNLITETLVRRLINPFFDATLRKARQSHLNGGPSASEIHPYNHGLIKSLRPNSDETLHPGSESQICLTTILARLLSQSLKATCIVVALHVLWPNLAMGDLRPPCGFAISKPPETYDIVVPVGIVVLEGTEVQTQPYSDRSGQAFVIDEALKRASTILVEEVGICLDLYFIARPTDRIPTGGVRPDGSLVEYHIDCPESLTDAPNPCFSDYVAGRDAAACAAAGESDACLLGRAAENAIDRAGTALADNPPPHGWGGGGRGYIGVFANLLNGGDGTAGLSGGSYAIPVSLLHWGISATNPQFYGRTIAHEFCHVFGDLSHTSDPDRLMTQGARGGTGTTLTDDEAQKVRLGAQHRSLQSEHDSWLDDIGEVSQEFIDLSVGQLYVADFGRDLVLAVLFDGLFPASPVDVRYDAFIDTDNDPTTGLTVDTFGGTDKVVHVAASGDFPFLGTSAATIADTITGDVATLAAPSFKRSEKLIAPDAIPASVPQADWFVQAIPLSTLDISGTRIGINLKATNQATGDTDVVSFELDLSAEILIADLSVDSVDVQDAPAGIAVPSTESITVNTSVTNLGPDGPIDADIGLEITAPSGVLVSPTSVSKSLTNLVASTPREVIDVFDITCVDPGHYTIRYDASASASNPSVSDPDPTNNQQSTNMTLACRMPVQISITPNETPNAINLVKNGFIPVAVLTNAAFDATTVDPSTVIFAGAGLAMRPRGYFAQTEDVDGDGDLDLVLHFDAQDTDIVCGDAQATLIGETLGGTPVVGTDSIVTVGAACR